MRMIVFPGAGGIISSAGQILGQALPEGAVLVEVESADLPSNSAARVKPDGSVEIVANWVGSGPWFDQSASTANRETAIHITELGVDPEAEGWAMTPRPETSAERTAREAAEAAAASAAAAQARLAANVSMAQFRKALHQVGLLGAVTAVMAAEGTPEAIKIDWEYATEVRRAWPAWGEFLPLIDKTESDLDAVFALAATL